MTLTANVISELEQKRTACTFAALSGISMAHLRSPEALVRREANRFVRDTSFRDPIMAETVCMVDRDTVIDHLSDTFEGVTIGYVPDIELALVLSDSRGRGYHQR